MLSALEQGVEGLRIGVAREYSEVEGIEAGVRARVDEALLKLEAAGAELVDVALPHTDYGLAAYYIVAPAEASSNLARFDGIEWMTTEVDLWPIAEHLEGIPHVSLLTPAMARKLSPLDARLKAAGLLHHPAARARTAD
jgi:Asp-tRNA(Asn)/Glu-tRNA(Gln) amidotransferase A subunit family amidase